MPAKVVTFNLNGRETDVLAQPLVTLQSLLREQLRYTATKTGCRQGGCGSCTVLVNGEPVLSCLTPAEDVAGQDVTTLEGITPNDGLDPIQDVFYQSFAVQCGYCTPGMILVTKALLEKNPEPSRADVVDAISGNFCRCTGYEAIIQAIQEAAHSTNGHSA